MKIPLTFISCDWGTTNIRLKVIETETLNVLANFASNAGVKTVYQEYLKETQIEQFDYFYNTLIGLIDNLPVAYQNNLIVISGMASSSIGMFEMDYADIPFSITGKGLHWKLFNNLTSSDVLLISGVRDVVDVMRGEEAQVIGLNTTITKYEKGILILPGTHSKHVYFDTNEIVGFKTYMTGELFELLSKNSILSNSVNEQQWSTVSEKAFLKGLHSGFRKELTAHLFTIRANDILNGTSKNEGFYFLSGLLIGDELSYIENDNEQFILFTCSPLLKLYEIALAELFPNQKHQILDDAIETNAVVKGHFSLLKMVSKLN
ncbi:2-dehydro-3-deoxygalactonokinase [Maribacter sp. 1_MG-2023]|uniref:2-dehydro-3-deoxygalactonokinase n=1 Tax=Maribacter sp. 1_MG-2023 TaxID=3062677 RepID=UPI0026E39C4D|nr:2-dehydro-3-deoxygalactonokinase [Maribacter sp. 1_MG-2023]MDO6470463.1 2-dehydro-3-deoxygalactonokinase [Maribacter sp. 1_MG-2023]